MLNLSLGLSLGSLATTRGGSAASRLLNLIKNDTGTALIWDYAKTDRRFAEPIGGANPVASGDIVGLDLDSSKWGGKAFAQVLADQPELLANPNFDANLSGWTAAAQGSGVVPTWVSGSVFLTRTDASNHGRLYQAIPTEIGSTYCIRTVNSGATGSHFIQASTTAGGNNLLSEQAVAKGASSLHFITATTTTTYVMVRAVDNNYSAHVTSVSVCKIPGFHARQGTGSSKPKWQAGPKPFLELDGVDDYSEINLLPGATGTMVVAFRPSTVGGSRNQFILSGGTATGDKRARIGISTGGYVNFNLNNSFNTGSTVDYDKDLVAIQTWGGGRRRCYVTTATDPLILDQAFTPNLDGTGNTYKVGSLESPTEYAKGRLYGALIRSVETSDADVRNIILPAFKGLF